MKNIKYHMDIGATSVRTNIMMEATKGLGQRDIKYYTKDCFIFESWFASNISYEIVMHVGADIIGVVKTNTKGFCKYNTKNLTQDCPGGSSILLEIKYMVPSDRPLKSIRYKYNTCKVISFVST